LWKKVRRRMVKERVTRIRKGLDIKLKGTAEKVFTRIGVKGDYTLYPADFPGLVPHLLVQEGDIVKAGTPLFTDKKDERIRFASPVGGKVVTIEEGSIGGLGSAVSEFAVANNYTTPLKIITLPDVFIPHGSVAALRKLAHLLID